MLYSEVDGAITDWATENSLHLFREWNGKESRFSYLTNDFGECYQIVVSPPENDRIKVDVWIIEGNDAVDYHLELYASGGIIHKVLNNVLGIVRAGMK